MNATQMADALATRGQTEYGDGKVINNGSTLTVRICSTWANIGMDVDIAKGRRYSWKQMMLTWEYVCTTMGRAVRK